MPGDLMVAFFVPEYHTYGSPFPSTYWQVVTPPAGWTVADSTSVCYKIAGSSEPSSYTFSVAWSGGNPSPPPIFVHPMIVTYRGVNQSSPNGGLQWNAVNPGNTYLSVSSFTATAAGQLIELLMAYSTTLYSSGVNSTPEAGATERYDNAVTDSGASIQTSLYSVADKSVSAGTVSSFNLDWELLESGVGLAFVAAAATTTPTYTSSPAVSYPAYTRLGPVNTPATIQFTASDTQNTSLYYEVRTASDGGGTLVTSGSCTHATAKSAPVAYNDPGISNGDNTLYVRVSNGVNAVEASVTLKLDTNNPSVYLPNSNLSYG